MIKLNSIAVKNFKNIRRAAISLHDLVVITGPENSGISDLLHVFPFLDLIINGSDEDIHSYFEIGEAPGIGSIINTTGKENGTVEFSLSFSDSTDNSLWIYNLKLYWAKGQNDFIQEESLGVIADRSTNVVEYIFNRDVKQILSCKDLEMYLKKVFPDSEQSVIRVLQNINAQLVNSQIGPALRSFDELLQGVCYFSGATLKHDKINSLFGSGAVGEDLQTAIGMLEKEKVNWSEFKTMLNTFLGITHIEVHHVESNNTTTDKTTCYSVFTQNGNEIFLNQLPETSVNLITLLTRIFLTRHHLFLVEEPEKSISPSNFQHILEHLTNEEFPIQFIISTNSVSLINAVLPQNIMIAVSDKDGMYEIENISNIMNKRHSGKDSPAFGNESFFKIDTGNDN